MHTYRAHTQLYNMPKVSFRLMRLPPVAAIFALRFFFSSRRLAKRSTCALSWNRTDRCILFRTEAASALRRWISWRQFVRNVCRHTLLYGTVSTCNASLQIYHWKKRSCKRTVDAFNKLNLTSRKSAALFVCCRPEHRYSNKCDLLAGILLTKRSISRTYHNTSTSPTNLAEYPIAPWSVPVQVKVAIHNRITWRDNANSSSGLIHHPLTDLWSRKAIGHCARRHEEQQVWNM